MRLLPQPPSLAREVRGRSRMRSRIWRFARLLHERSWGAAAPTPAAGAERKRTRSPAPSHAEASEGLRRLRSGSSRQEPRAEEPWARLPLFLRQLVEEQAVPSVDARVLLAFFKPPRVEGIPRGCKGARRAAAEAEAKARMVGELEELRVKAAPVPSCDESSRGPLVLAELHRVRELLPEALRLVGDSTREPTSQQLVDILFAAPPDPGDWLPLDLQEAGRALLDLALPGRPPEAFADSSTATYDAVLKAWMVLVGARLERVGREVELLQSDIGDTVHAECSEDAKARAHGWALRRVPRRH